METAFQQVEIHFKPLIALVFVYLF